jgi:hypothetical protein
MNIRVDFPPYEGGTVGVDGVLVNRRLMRLTASFETGNPLQPEQIGVELELTDRDDEYQAVGELCLQLGHCIMSDVTKEQSMAYLAKDPFWSR